VYFFTFVLAPIMYHNYFIVAAVWLCTCAPQVPAAREPYTRTVNRKLLNFGQVC